MGSNQENLLSRTDERNSKSPSGTLSIREIKLIDDLSVGRAVTATAKTAARANEAVRMILGAACDSPAGNLACADVQGRSLLLGRK